MKASSRIALESRLAVAEMKINSLRREEAADEKAAAAEAEAAAEAADSPSVQCLGFPDEMIGVRLSELVGKPAKGTPAN